MQIFVIAMLVAGCAVSNAPEAELDSDQQVAENQQTEDDQQFAEQNQEQFENEQQFAAQNQEQLQNQGQFENEQQFAAQNQEQLQNQGQFENEQQFAAQNQEQLQNQEQFENEQQLIAQNQEQLQNQQSFQNEEGLEADGNFSAPLEANAGEQVDLNPEEEAASTLMEYAGIPQPNAFSGVPPIPGSRKNLAVGEAPQHYTIESGDTLYDICDQLLGEPDYWPKLWALNSVIKNPHFIYPNFVLQFFPGDASSPPSIRVVNIEELTPKGAVEGETLVTESVEGLFKVEQESDLELLNPEDIVVPPEIRELFDESETFDYGKASVVQLPGIIFENKVDYVGEVLGSIEGSLSIQDIAVGYVEGNLLEEGKTYTVLRYRGKVRTGSSFYGYRYDFISTITVRGFTGERGIAKADVFNSVTLTEVGDLIVEYLSRSRKVTEVGVEASDVDASIVSLTYNGQTIGAIGDFAFLAVDDGSGAAKHQLLKIYKNVDTKRGFSLRNVDDPHEIGTLQIIDISEQGAIGYIIETNREIYLGDRVGSG